MINFTDGELEVGRIAYNQALIWDQHLKKLVENGKIKIKNFSKKTRFLMALGSTKTRVVSNSALLGLGWVVTPAELQ
jgi:hypothetical protein